METVEFDVDLIRRYAGSGPRYTSYPTAMEFSPSVGEQDYIDWVRESNISRRPLSLYVHLPFCAHVCENSIAVGYEVYLGPLPA